LLCSLLAIHIVIHSSIFKYSDRSVAGEWQTSGSLVYSAKKGFCMVASIHCLSGPFVTSVLYWRTENTPSDQGAFHIRSSR